MRQLLCIAIVMYWGVVVTMEFESENMSGHFAPVRDERESSCNCYNSTDEFVPEIECRCYGRNLRIPEDLGDEVHRLTITDSDITIVKKDDLQPYKMTLRDVILANLHSLRVIEAGTFRDMPNLRTVYISDAPKLTFLPGLFEGVTSKKFLSLRIVSTNLMEIPDLSHLPDETLLHMLDLEGNKIDHLRANAIKINAAQVTLNHNGITAVDDYAFNGSQIGKLSLKANIGLIKISPMAFAGLKSLSQLDLSDTSIEGVPVVGLGEIEILKIENTPTMKYIPSVYDFPNLKEAFLTHPFHCCAFKYPEQHDPARHAQYEEKLKRFCNKDASDTGQQIQETARKKRNSDFDDSQFWDESFVFTNNDAHHDNDIAESSDYAHLRPGHANSVNRSNTAYLHPLIGETIERQAGKPVQNSEPLGHFHHSFAEIPNKVAILCGNFSIRTSLIKCHPEPNALNPCEDIMGSYYLRVSVWFVVILAMVGNLAVIVVVLFSGGEVTVSRFLMCNLAFADFCMGLYLLLIASMDVHSVGSYFNFAFDWQYGLGCQVSGFLTMFAGQLSIFTLTVVTVERWFAIAYAIYLTRRIRLGLAAKVMIGGWFYSILMASIPLMGVSNYSSTSICLPMEANSPMDKAYLASMIITNGLAFALIVFCYAQIYFSLGYDTRHCSTKGEMTIAKKMALLVFTDFICWAPIAFFALTALAGYPLIGVTRSKILLVFFYPLNSCANPYLYAIMTAQYRKDFFVLLYRCGICTKKAKQYAMNSSLPTTNNSHPVPLLARTNLNNPKQNNVDDAFV